MTSPFAFAPGTSWLHRRSPVAKLAWLGAAVVFAFAAYHPIPLAIVAGAGLTLAVAAGAGRPVLRAMAILGPLAASIMVLQALAPATCAGSCREAARLGPLVIADEGFTRGVALVLRILAMETWAVAVLVTTHPSDLFAGLRRLRVPYALALMTSLTMQLVPVLQREVDLVLVAQRARGLPATGPAAAVRALRPAFVATFERVQGMAISMESRGLGLGRGRTSWRNVQLDRVDRVLALGGVALGLAGATAAVAWWGPTAVPVIEWPAPVAIAGTAASAIAFAGLLLRALPRTARPV